jgi:hypothetical protein
MGFIAGRPGAARVILSAASCHPASTTTPSAAAAAARSSEAVDLRVTRVESSISRAAIASEEGVAARAWS